MAADFPELTIVLAHPSVPWQVEAISIATHKENVYIDRPRPEGPPSAPSGVWSSGQVGRALPCTPHVQIAA